MKYWPSVSQGRLTNCGPNDVYVGNDPRTHPLSFAGCCRLSDFPADCMGTQGMNWAHRQDLEEGRLQW